MELGLVQEYLIHALRMVLSCHRESRMPVLLVLVHVDCLLGLVRLDELLLSLFESILILKVQGVLEMNLRKLVLGVVVGKSEGVVKSLLIGLEVHGGFDQTILNEELSSLLAFHVLGNLDSDLSKLLGVTIGFGDSQSVLPHFVGPIHVDTNLPGTSFDVMMLGLLQVTLNI